MRKIILTMLFGLLLPFGAVAQNIIKGIVLDNDTEKPLQNVSVSIKALNSITYTALNGSFALSNLTSGKHIVEIKLEGYETQNFPIELSEKIIDLGTILMYENYSEEQDLSTITITDDELNDNVSAADNISGLLQSSRDIYLRTAAFEFSSSFFRVKGLGSNNAKLLINGIEMNKLQTGRPQWANWGGLNAVLRNQEFSAGLSASSHTFGGVLGATNISTRASEYRAGGRISFASSNRNYTQRVMATYASGLINGGWAFTVSASRRAGDQGYVNGTSYNATSLFLSLEKEFNENHSLNFTSIAAPNKRGKSSASTQEVYHLKGTQYNSYWGFQNGKMRNSRMKETFEPILMLNYYWTIDNTTSLNTNVAYQYGKVGNSRIDYNGSKANGIDGDGNPYIIGLGGNNPDPTYYQKLPSYGLRNGLPNVYEIEQYFLNDGQLNWNVLYTSNANSFNNGRSAYILYEDRNDDQQFTVNTILDKEINDNITLNGRLQYKSLRSENFANVIDLLGGNGYLDIDTFADSFDEKQNNLLELYT